MSHSFSFLPPTNEVVGMYSICVCPSVCLFTGVPCDLFKLIHWYFKILPQKSFYIAKMECSKFKLLVAPTSWKRKWILHWVYVLEFKIFTAANKKLKKIKCIVRTVRGTSIWIRPMQLENQVWSCAHFFFLQIRVFVVFCTVTMATQLAWKQIYTKLLDWWNKKVFYVIRKNITVSFLSSNSGIIINLVNSLGPGWDPIGHFLANT